MFDPFTKIHICETPEYMAVTIDCIESEYHEEQIDQNTKYVIIYLKEDMFDMSIIQPISVMRINYC